MTKTPEGPDLMMRRRSSWSIVNVQTLLIDSLPMFEGASMIPSCQDALNWDVIAVGPERTENKEQHNDGASELSRFCVVDSS